MNNNIDDRDKVVTRVKVIECQSGVRKEVLYRTVDDIELDEERKFKAVVSAKLSANKHELLMYREFIRQNLIKIQELVETIESEVKTKMTNEMLSKSKNVLDAGDLIIYVCGRLMWMSHRLEEVVKNELDIIEKGV